MLKAYALEDLKVGMIIGKDVVGDGGNVLIAAGTPLTKEHLALFGERSMFAVIIDEPEPIAVEEQKEPAGMAITTALGSEYLVDTVYVHYYEMLMQEVTDLFDDIIKRNVLDPARLERMTSHVYISELCNGAKAVAQIHNMPAKGDYLVEHSSRVAILAGLLARWMKWPREKQKSLMISAFLHDVGNLRLSKDILNKKGKLTPAEFDIIKKHPEYGYHMLINSCVAGNRDIMLGIYQHHERCDGTGYPKHVKQEAISEYARILMILDMYNAMISNRSYSKRRSPFDVFNIIYEDVISGKVDTTYAVQFMRELCHCLMGSWVQLSDGQKARIVYIDESRVTSYPVVQIDMDHFIDLNTNKDVKIEALLTSDELV